MIVPDTIPMVVQRVETVTPLIKQFTLAAQEGQSLPAFSAGSHIIVNMQAGERTLRNAYSLLNSPGDRSVYEIAVRRMENSRGGSQFMHDRVNAGTRLEISAPVNLFPRDKRALAHILIAGGVGITPFLAYMHELTQAGEPVELHYAVRDAMHGGFAQRIARSWPQHINVYVESENARPDPSKILASRPLGTHVYVCGPSGMIDDVVSTARRLGWTDSHIHFERFTAAPQGEAFDVFLQRSGVKVRVPGDVSLLEAIERAGIKAPYLCRGGACGQCETEVLQIEGDLIHHDIYLSEADRASRRKILPCVSRARCQTLVLDR